MTFNELELIEPLNRAIADLGFEKPSPIQVKSIPILKDSQRDFVGQAQTGTGKTAAFVLPLLEKIDLAQELPQALILTPTRELAKQVHEQIEKLGKYLDLSTTTVYGGTSYQKQFKALKGDCPHIVVGTPGRLIDLLERKVLKLENCHHLVIDEADEMLNMGFIEDVQKIIDCIETKPRLWMFSATMPKSIVKLIEEKFDHPQLVRTQAQEENKKNIEQFFGIYQGKHLKDALLRFLEGQEEDCAGIVFCETRNQTKELGEWLGSKGVLAEPLHGEMNQAQREAALNRFRNKKINYLVCTDVAARGIDVPHITHVFNMGLPRQKESYVHRIGRSGRAGAKGTAVSLITHADVRQLQFIEKDLGYRLKTVELPSVDAIKKNKIQRELNRMDPLKEALIRKESESEAFDVDQSFDHFEAFFKDLSKEQALKLLFSTKFNKEIYHLNNGVVLKQEKPKFSNFSRGGSGGGKGGGGRFDRRRRFSSRQRNFKRGSRR